VGSFHHLPHINKPIKNVDSIIQWSIINLLLLLKSFWIFPRHKTSFVKQNLILALETNNELKKNLIWQMYSEIDGWYIILIKIQDFYLQNEPRNKTLIS